MTPSAKHLALALRTLARVAPMRKRPDPVPARGRAEDGHPNLHLDAKDLKLLEVIQRRGRIPKGALAKAIGLSLTACTKRLSRLEDAGVLSGYHGVIDTKSLGSCLWTHTAVMLARHRAADFARFEAAVEAIPEVIECDAVGGGFDYLLKFVTRDVEHYQKIIEGLLDERIGMQKYFTYIVTKRAKLSAAIPLGSLIDGEE